MCCSEGNSNESKLYWSNYIKGESKGIFDFGLWAGLIGKAGDQNFKLHTTIMPEDEYQVRVTASGSYDNVTNFYEYIKKNDEGLKYKVRQSSVKRKAKWLAASMSLVICTT